MAKTTTPTISNLRADIAALKTKRTALIDAPRARAESRADIDRQCREWAASCKQRFDYPLGMVALGGSISELFRIHPQGNFVDLGPTLAYVLGPERLAEILAPGLEQRTDGLAAVDRAAQLAEIDRQLLEIERAEEALIEASEAAGTPIARRGDADPRAVLGV